MTYADGDINPFTCSLTDHARTREARRRPFTEAEAAAWRQRIFAEPMEDPAAKMAAPYEGEVINRGGSYQQAPASSSKKAEGKKRKSPFTPYREKGKGKETRRGFLREPYLSRAHAYVRGTLARACAKRRGELLLRRVPCRLRKPPELQIKLLARRRFRRRQKKFSAFKIRPKSTKFGFPMLLKCSKSRLDI